MTFLKIILPFLLICGKGGFLSGQASAFEPSVELEWVKVGFNKLSFILPLVALGSVSGVLHVTMSRDTANLTAADVTSYHLDSVKVAVRISKSTFIRNFIVYVKPEIVLETEDDRFGFNMYRSKGVLLKAPEKHLRQLKNLERYFRSRYGT